MELVTQLAYCNFDLAQYKLDSKKGESPTIQEYLKWYVDAKHGLYSIFYNYDNEANHAPDASEDKDKDIDIYELNEEEYGKLFNLLFSGKACCHLEDEERWGYVRNEFKITIGNTVKRNWEKIVQIYSV